jgi:hypothetical protein
MSERAGLEMDGVRCFHSDPPDRKNAALPERAEAAGIVVCGHAFGVGVYLPEQSAWGHVNLPALARLPDGSPQIPRIGEHLPLVVLGYSGTGQLRLAHREAQGLA